MSAKFSRDEVEALTKGGFAAGYVTDLREGDEVIIPPYARLDKAGWANPVKAYVVARILRTQKDPLSSVTFIGLVEGLPEHAVYDHSWPCFIRRR